MPASHLHKTNAALRLPLPADRSTSNEIGAITAEYASNSAVDPANTAEIASPTTASHLPRTQSSQRNPAVHAAITATFAAAATAS